MICFAWPWDPNISLKGKSELQHSLHSTNIQKWCCPQIPIITGMVIKLQNPSPGIHTRSSSNALVQGSKTHARLSRGNKNKLYFTQDRESLKVTCSVTSVLWSKVMENDTVTNHIWHILLNCDQCEMIQNKRSSHAIIVFSWSIIAVASEFSCPHALTPIPNSQWFLMSGCWHTWPGFLSHLLFSRRCGTQGQNLD